MRRLGLLITLVMFLTCGFAFSQSISPVFFGQNAWMPDTIGTKVLYGKLHKKWGEIKGSGAQIIRFGGIAPDENMPTNHQYIKMIDSVRAKGMEPIMQVPYHKGQYTAAQAAAIVKYVNVTKARNVKYWIIGNEPDLGYSYTSASQIAPYIKSFASAMKAVDPTIKTIGPENAWYNHPIFNALTTAGGPDDITGKDAAGRYYIDIISFHTYPFSGTQTRGEVITKLMSPYNLNDNLAALNTKLANCNTYHGRTASPVKVAITEANVNYKNNATDNLNGSGANSFIGGQFWAEMCGIALKHKVEFINFWSVLEGNSNELNIGYLDRTTGGKKPTYYHFQMMSQNLKGNYANGTDNQANVKAFGSKNSSQVTVMILNQDLSANFNYTLRLNNETVSGTNALKINIDGGIAKENTGVISAQSTLMLVFDLSGNLVKKIEYKLNGNANLDLAPTVTTYNVTAPALTATITPAGPVSFCTGGNVVLNANTGSGYTYQWKKNGVVISGATSASYTATTTGSYQVKVTSGTAYANSALVQVTANALPTSTITASGSTTLSSGQSVVLTANSGTGFTYQWKKNGVNITGATAISYSANSAGSYTVTVKNGSGCSATSVAKSVTVSGLTATITPASTTTFCQGGSVILKGNTGTNYTYQWKKNGVVITGATASSYTAKATGSYQLKITQGTSTASSALVQVTVKPLVQALITASGPTTFAPGSSVVLKANTGTGITYQWKKNGVAINGATASSYTATTAGSYTVYETVTNGCPATSPAVTVTVTTSLVATITPASSTSICPEGGSVILKANTGTNYYYTWKKNGTVISGATASNYTATTAGTYTVTIKYGTSTKTSTGVSVTVQNVVAQITPSGSLTIPSGGKVILNSSTGTGYTYQWKKNGVLISGATLSSYTATTAGSYQVKTMVGTCYDWSAPVSVVVGSGARIASTDSVVVVNIAGNGVTTITNTTATSNNGNVTNPATMKVSTDSSAKIAVAGKGSAKNKNEKLAVSGKGSDKTEQANEEVLSEDVAQTVILDTVFTLKTYPNPTTGPLYLQIYNPEGAISIEMQVFNLSGQIVFNKTLNLEEEFKTDVLELGDLSSGAYFLKVTRGDKVETIKFIISK